MKYYTPIVFALVTLLSGCWEKKEETKVTPVEQGGYHHVERPEDTAIGREQS